MSTPSTPRTTNNQDPVPGPKRRSGRIVAIVAGLLLAGGALVVVRARAENRAVEQAAREFVASTEWTQDDERGGRSFEGLIYHTFRYDTATSQSDACEAAQRNLADWAGVQVADLHYEEPERANDRRACTVRVQTFTAKLPADIRSGEVTVYRARVNSGDDVIAEYLTDTTQVGGVNGITVDFRKPT